MNAKWNVLRRQAAAMVVALTAAACSTADYSKPVNDFAAATGEAEKALTELNTQVTEAYSEVLENSILNRRVFLKADADNCDTRSQRCRLIMIDENGNTIVDDNGNPETYPPEPPLALMTQLMSEVDAYAANLKALIEADTAEQVATQVNAALGSIQNLAETVAKANPGAGAPASVPQFATPVGAAVNWVVGQYVESVKFRGLQRATEAAKPVVRNAANIFTITSDFISDAPRTDLAEEVRVAADAFRNAGDESSLKRYVQAAAKYDALLTSTPPNLFKSMGDAHDALAESLQGGGLTLGTAIARIEAFAAEAEKLAKILQDLRAIAAEG